MMPADRDVTAQAKLDAFQAVYRVRHDLPAFHSLVRDVLPETADREQWQRAAALITALAAAVPLDVVLGEAWEWTEARRSAA